MKLNRRLGLLLGLSLSLSLLSACATSPEGRTQLMALPDSTVNSQGSEAFDQMKKTTPIETSPQMNSYVRCVANAIVDANQDRIKETNWEVVVFRSKEINAFALPGAKIGVYTGILPIAHTPAQLGAVLGHEVGHVLARHGNERMTTALVTQGLVMGAGMAAKDSHYQQVILAALGGAAQVGIILPFSRTQEAEADIIGLELMAKAGFDPNESIALWENMTKAFEGKEPPEIMSDHPSNAKRIANLRSHLPAAVAVYEKVKSSAPGTKCAPLSGSH